MSKEHCGIIIIVLNNITLMFISRNEIKSDCVVLAVMHKRVEHFRPMLSNRRLVLLFSEVLRLLTEITEVARECSIVIVLRREL